MSAQTKRHVNPENIPAFYKFHLSQGVRWSGSAEHGGKKQKQHTVTPRQWKSMIGLHIETSVAETNSKKILIGDKVRIDVYFDKNNDDAIGSIHKFKDGVHFFVNVSWEFLSHLNLILSTSTADCITIEGTELYRRSGYVYNILVVNDRVER